MNKELLRELCAIHAPSGDEGAMHRFVLDYINKHQNDWKVQPEILTGKGFQDAIILKFGTPHTAVFAHMDSVGYTVAYDNQLIPIGGPKTRNGDLLVGRDAHGPVEGEYQMRDEKAFIHFNRPVERGTTLVYKPHFRETEDYIQCCYMDNRLGMLAALELCPSLEHGVVVFSTYEEHGGGSVGFIARHLYEQWSVQQAIISDITWVTDGVKHGDGVAISLRDSGIPRKSYLDRIVHLANASGITYQLEVEGAGGSDGNQLQRSPYPFDWVFIGAPENHVHTVDEQVHKADYEAMIQLYRYLMAKMG